MMSNQACSTADSLKKSRICRQSQPEHIHLLFRKHDAKPADQSHNLFPKVAIRSNLCCILMLQICRNDEFVMVPSSYFSETRMSAHYFLTIDKLCISVAILLAEIIVSANAFPTPLWQRRHTKSTVTAALPAGSFWTCVPSAVNMV